MSAMCQALLVAGVVAPIMILSALQFGVIRDLRAHFEATPDNLRLFPASSISLSPDWFAKWGKDPQVGFLAPHPYENAVELTFEAVGRGKGVEAVILASGPGDLMLPPDVAPPKVLETVLTASLAEELGVAVGDRVSLVGFRPEPETYSRLQLRVIGVTPRSRWSSEGALVNTEVVTQAWMWRQGYSSQLFGLDGEPPPATVSFPRFRLYARKLSDLQPLATRLNETGVGVAGNFADANLADAVESGVRAAATVLVVAAAIGAALALIAGFLADGERLRPSVRLLRLDGVTRGGVRAMLLWKALIIGGGGWLLGAGVYAVGLFIVNAGLARAGLPFETAGRLPWTESVIIAAVTLAVAVVAGLAATGAALRRSHL